MLKEPNCNCRQHRLVNRLTDVFPVDLTMSVADRLKKGPDEQQYLTYTHEDAIVTRVSGLETVPFIAKKVPLKTNFGLSGIRPDTRTIHITVYKN